MNSSTILLLTPLREEQAMLVAALARLGHAPEPGSTGRLPCLHFGRMSLTLAIGGHGKAQFAVQTTHLIERLGDALKLVVCAGAAGGLAHGVAVGDLVAATETVEHDYTLRFVQRPLPAFPGDAATLEELRAAHGRGAFPFALHRGRVASGDEDVICPVRGRELVEKTGAVCVAWEGSGAARACRFAAAPFVELRGITDSADSTAAADFDTNLARAMANLAGLLHVWLGA